MEVHWNFYSTNYADKTQFTPWKIQNCLALNCKTWVHKIELTIDSQPHPTSPYPNPQFYPAKKKTFNSTQGVFWETKKFKIMVKLSHN